MALEGRDKDVDFQQRFILKHVEVYAYQLLKDRSDLTEDAQWKD